MKFIEEKDLDLEASDQEMNSVGYSAAVYTGLAILWLILLVSYFIAV